MTILTDSQKKSIKYKLGTDSLSPISKSNIQDGVGEYIITELTYGSVASSIIEEIDNHIYPDHLVDAIHQPKADTDYRIYDEYQLSVRGYSKRTTQEIAFDLEEKARKKIKTIFIKLSELEEKRRKADSVRSKSRHKSKAKIKLKKARLNKRKDDLNDRKNTQKKINQQIKSEAVEYRRREYKSNRAVILLKMLAAGMNYSCSSCKTTKNITIDHILPISKGGADEISNLDFLCQSCNSKKGAKTQA